jgi:cephalosporin hydroxylase
MTNKSPAEIFIEESKQRIAGNEQNAKWRDTTAHWLDSAFHEKYMYNFFSLGRPIIQLPQDIVAVQELTWLVKPDLIIETGIAHGGSLIASAANLAILDLCDAIANGKPINPSESERLVLGIDIDIRAHNREAIEKHPMASRIKMIEGSSIAKTTVDQVKEIAKGFNRVMICMDSNHVHDHVLKELESYAHLTSVGSYCVVFDTIVQDLRDDMFPDRPWSHGNNPKTAVREFLETNKNFVVDTEIDNKLLISSNPGGYLKRIS